jgi:hypothetical protein
MRHMKLLALLLVFFSDSVVLAEDFRPARIDVAKPRPPKEGCVNEYYYGIVTEVTKDSITVEWPGEKPKKFAVSDTLVAGRVPMEPRQNLDTGRAYTVMASSMYRMTDVKVGDIVSIYYAHIGGVSICDHICISKRPGGRVPPLPEEAEMLRRGPQHPGLPPRQHIQYHELRNAYWDLEDKGIPYPEKFGPFRRWPAAPAPREVKIGHRAIVTVTPRLPVSAPSPTSSRRGGRG